MLTRVAADKNPPYDLPIPNPETVAAIEEGRRHGQKSYDTIDALMTDLFADE